MQIQIQIQTQTQIQIQIQILILQIHDPHSLTPQVILHLHPPRQRALPLTPLLQPRLQRLQLLQPKFFLDKFHPLHEDPQIPPN